MAVFSPPCCTYLAHLACARSTLGPSQSFSRTVQRHDAPSAVTQPDPSDGMRRAAPTPSSASAAACAATAPHARANASANSIGSPAGVRVQSGAGAHCRRTRSCEHTTTRRLVAPARSAPVQRRLNETQKRSPRGRTSLLIWSPKRLGVPLARSPAPAVRGRLTVNGCIIICINRGVPTGRLPQAYIVQQLLVQY